MDINENLTQMDKARKKRYQKEKLAMYLLSKEAEMVCGETVVLDGAYAIR